MGDAGVRSLQQVVEEVHSLSGQRSTSKNFRILEGRPRGSNSLVSKPEAFRRYQIHPPAS
jgi:hypothetical protein